MKMCVAKTKIKEEQGYDPSRSSVLHTWKQKLQSSIGMVHCWFPVKDLAVGRINLEKQTAPRGSKTPMATT